MFGKESKNQVDAQLFVIYDSKTQSYGNPVIAVNSHDLHRQMYASLEKDKNENRFYANAEDFSVFKIADYCRTTGVLTPCQHESVFNFHEMRSAIDNNSQDLTLDEVKKLIAQHEAIMSSIPDLRKILGQKVVPGPGFGRDGH